MWRKLGLIGLGIGAFGGGLIATSLLANPSQPRISKDISAEDRITNEASVMDQEIPSSPPCSKPEFCQKDGPVEWLNFKKSKSKYDELASIYDQKVHWDEAITGLNGIRRRLLQHAQGSLLEVAIGTGRNFDFYPTSKITAITAIDQSDAMLQVAKIKSELAQEVVGKDKHSFLLMDAHQMSSTFPPASFDTVLDTFGLCSFQDPVQVLKEMQRVCEPDGRILLLEHGKSNWHWLQKYMNHQEKKHFDHWGCHYNRDLQEILEESGIDILESKRHDLGTIYFIVAKPGPSFHQEGQASKLGT